MTLLLLQDINKNPHSRRNQNGNSDKTSHRVFNSCKREQSVSKMSLRYPDWKTVTDFIYISGLNEVLN